MVMGACYSFLQVQDLAHNLHFMSSCKIGFDYYTICFWKFRCQLQYIVLFLPGADFSCHFKE